MTDAMQRQRNISPHTAQLPERLGPSGELLPAWDVDPGEEIDYPFRLVGFDGWTDPDGGEPAGAGKPDADAEAPTSPPKQPAKKAAASAQTEGAAP